MGCCTLALQQRSSLNETVSDFARNFIQNASGDASVLGDMKYHLIGRTLAGGTFLLTAAEAITRLAMLIISAAAALCTFFSVQDLNAFVTFQAQKGYAALTMSTLSFAAIFSPNVLVNNMPIQTGSATTTATPTTTTAATTIPAHFLVPDPAEQALAAPLPNRVIQGTCGQFNLHNHTYGLDHYQYCPIQESLRNVPDANQGCNVMTLAMISHLYNNGPLNTYYIDAVMAQGSRVDHAIRTASPRGGGFGIDETFNLKPAHMLANLRYDDLEIPIGLLLDPVAPVNNEINFRDNLIELANRGANQPIGAALYRGHHFIMVFIDQNAAGIQGIYVFEPRGPMNGTAGRATFEPLGNDPAAAGRRLAQILPAQDVLTQALIDRGFNDLNTYNTAVMFPIHRQ